MRSITFSERGPAIAARWLIGRAMGAPFTAVRATNGVHIEPAVVGDRWCRARRVRGQTQWILFIDDDVVAMADMENDSLLRERVILPGRRAAFRSLVASATEIDVDICDDDDDDADLGSANA